MWLRLYARRQDLYDSTTSKLQVGRADKYILIRTTRADKDSYPHDSNVTDDLCRQIRFQNSIPYD